MLAIHQSAGGNPFGNTNTSVFSTSEFFESILKGTSDQAFKTQAAADSKLLKVSKANNVAGKVGTGLTLLSASVSAFQFGAARNNSGRLQAGSDTVASVVGLMGPVGNAFSLGYTGGQLGDQAIGWASKKVIGTDLSPSRAFEGAFSLLDAGATALLGVDKSDPMERTAGMRFAVALGF